MKKLTLVLAVALALALAGVLHLWPQPGPPGFCVVTGDVEQEIVLGELPADVCRKLPQGGRGFSLAELVETAGPVSGRFSVLLLGSDDYFVQLKGSELDGCYIVQEDSSWNVSVSKHPQTAALNNLAKIVVADDTGSIAIGVNIISQGENYVSTTPGNMFRQQVSCYAHFTGEAETSQEYAAALFRQKRVLPLNTAVNEEIRSVLVMGKNGEFVDSAPGAGYLELEDSVINYLSPEGKCLLRDIAGVIINPPELLVTDAYTDALGHLDNGEPVILILIDGLGYHQYMEAKERELIPNLAALGPAERACTVYKPVATAGLAAIVTGQSPNINGVGDASATEPIMPTIFDVVEEKGKAHALVEGNTSVLKLNTAVRLSQDLISNSSTDADIFGNAMDEILKKPDLLVVHFHGVDDAGHKYGPLAPKTLEVLATMDVYIGLLLKEWPGKVIIVSGHGMHGVGDEGSHGNFQFEDMIVPYITK